MKGKIKMKIIRTFCCVYLVVLYGDLLTTVNAFGILDISGYAGHIMYIAFYYLTYISLGLPVGIVVSAALLVYDKRKNNRIIADVVLLILFVLGLAAVTVRIAGFIYGRANVTEPV